MSVSVVLSNAPAYAGGASFARVFVLLSRAGAIDRRVRRVTNKLVAAMAVLWLAVRVLLAAMAAACCAAGFGSGAQIGDAALVASATMMRMIPFGLTLGDGLVGALVLGGGSLAVSIAFERLAQRPSMGGGDIKLLAVV
ncbi:MAG: prepilin peptidase, partial [Ellagibacter isourolithinifaciens]